MAKTTKTKKENLKGMDKNNLQKQLTLLQENARVIRFKAEGSRSKNVKELASLRKQIARVLTEMNKNNKK
jgi:ribosomal protein L29